MDEKVGEVQGVNGRDQIVLLVKKELADFVERRDCLDHMILPVVVNIGPIGQGVADDDKPGTVVIIKLAARTGRILLGALSGAPVNLPGLIGISLCVLGSHMALSV